jgi:hypothetical protein
MSTLKANTIQNTSGGAVTLTNQSAAKAWWQMNGTGTAVVNDSLNISSLTDANTGRFSVSFSNSMGNATYSGTGSCGRNGGSFVAGDVEMPSEDATTSSAISFYSYNTSGVLGDAVYISGQINGDLA